MAACYVAYSYGMPPARLFEDMDMAEITEQVHVIQSFRLADDFRSAIISELVRRKDNDQLLELAEVFDIIPKKE